MTSDPTTEYAERVRDGDIVAGPHVRFACARHLADLERNDLVFDSKEAGRIMSFFHDALHLSGGQFEGKRFELMPWQQFVIGSLRPPDPRLPPPEPPRSARLVFRAQLPNFELLSKVVFDD